MGEFTSLIQGGPCIVKFTAPWCGPCQTLAPYYHQLAEKFSDRAKFIEVNLDISPEISRHFRLQGIPRIYFYQNGQRQDAFTIGGCDPQGLMDNTEDFMDGIKPISVAGACEPASIPTETVQKLPTFPMFGDPSIVGSMFMKPVEPGEVPSNMANLLADWISDESDSSDDSDVENSSSEEEIDVDDVPIEKSC